jgi:hypothetical protein
MNDGERLLKIRAIETEISALGERKRQLESEAAETDAKLKDAINDLYRLRSQRAK